MFRKIILILCFLVSFGTSTPSWAANFDTESFARIPILHEGRIKPMESFARAHLKRFSGQNKDAVPWLIETIFNPGLGEKQQILKIHNPDVLNLLQIERRKNKLFSYAEISQALNKKRDRLVSILESPQENWTPAQRDLVLLQSQTISLGDLLSSLTLFLPLNATLPETVPASLKPHAGKTLNYLNTLKFREALQDQMKRITREKGENIESYADSEQAITYLSFAVANLRQNGAKSELLRVMPGTNDSTWLSPWILILSGAGTPETAKLSDLWQDLAMAYHQGDTKTWSDVTEKIYDETMMAGKTDIRPRALLTERLYNKFRPFHISTGLYLLTLILLTAGSFWKRKLLINAAFLILACGALSHLTGVAARIYILERPPVSTLYESIIFVGLVAVFYGLMAYRKDKNNLWLFISAGLGVFLHIVGFSHDQDGDSFLMLTAVLNTNFWLTTHVICITTGYAFCLMTSMLAHFALIKAAAEGKAAPESKLFDIIHSTALVALLFTAVGTVLGGIWADQSWGRFWGWDPKENGALLIVLWLIWLIHGRISHQIKPFFLVSGLAYLSVIVALSWFGVNLLSVGLHAYGFTDSAAWTLGIFIAFETVLIGGLIWLIHTKKRRANEG